MTVYSDSTFAKESGLAASEIKGSPSVEIQREDGTVSYQPSSVDLHLDDEFLKQNAQDERVCVDQQETYPRYNYELTLDEDGYFNIQPGQFVLATTQETVHLDESVVGFLWGRSSVGRLGLFVENAGLCDPGYSGELTLELFNASPNTIALKEGMRIVQMTVHELTEDSPNDYSEKVQSKYNDQQSVTPSRLYKDFASRSDASHTSVSQTSDFQ